MSFADWKKRSKQYADLKSRHTDIANIETTCAAAYKAGERQGCKQAEIMAKIALRELEPQRDSKFWQAGRDGK